MRSRTSWIRSRPSPAGHNDHVCMAAEGLTGKNWKVLEQLLQQMFQLEECKRGVSRRRRHELL